MEKEPRKPDILCQLRIEEADRGLAVPLGPQAGSCACRRVAAGTPELPGKHGLAPRAPPAAAAWQVLEMNCPEAEPEHCAVSPDLSPQGAGWQPGSLVSVSVRMSCPTY